MADISKETLRRLIEEYRGDDLAGYVISLLDLSRTIQAASSALRREAEAEESRHRQERDKLAYRWQTLRDECPHWETMHHADPSGNDSFTECLLCGKEM